ncbi:MAG: hypothetical protein Q9177_005229, partial [Variospora cf. flavescens]
IVKHAILHVPSAFNSQTTRVVVLLGDEHRRVWDVTAQVYEQQLAREKFESANKRFMGFRAGYGTSRRVEESKKKKKKKKGKEIRKKGKEEKNILFYEDTDVIREFQAKFKTYEAKFPEWSDQTSGMHQFTRVVWTALEAEGLGVNLQHYNPLIDVRFQTEFNVPPTWSMKAQMVFGTPTEGPAVPDDKKEFQPVEERMKVYGAQ